MEDVETLVKTLIRYNEAYRSGDPLVSDLEYDRLVEMLREMDAMHPFLNAVEPEKFEGKIEVKHPIAMLSIEKAYSREELERFINRVEKEAKEVGIYNFLMRVTPKLDGLAARDDGKSFATRGNGEAGYEISSVFKKGVIPIGGRGRGIGEIVVVKSYFDEHLSDRFEHPRNMVVGIVSSDKLNEFAKVALQDRTVHFVPYNKLSYWEGSAEELLNGVEAITTDITEKTDYPLDGMVAGIFDEKIRSHMGATAHHYRWQIALKTKGETAATVVQNIKWQVGRTGNVTPVLEVNPVSLSGATIRRVTAHHAGLIREKQIGIDAEIEIIRSGEVIPKLEGVIKTSDQINIPLECPSCSTALEWNNDFLKCDNPDCPAQISQRISHWFRTLGNADWFGIKTIERLVNSGYDSLEKIYKMNEKDFLDIGFGPVQSKNLFEAIFTSRNKSVEDWRFLAALGISNLGKGDSRKLLTHIPIEKLVTTRVGDIEKIHGFGEVTSRSIVSGIEKIKDTIHHMLSLGFNLERTPVGEMNGDVESAIMGKAIVFTGKMQEGSREEMQMMARKLGAKVQTAVSGKTDYLVCGEKVGEKKIEKAKKSGVEILTESEYLQLVPNN